MSVQKVVLERPGDVRVETETARPLPGSDALVHFRIAGICGSDLSAYRGTSPLVTYPRILGHEVVVDVVSAPGHTELEGQRAVIDPMIPCGYCRACRVGRWNCCVRLQVMGVHVDGGLRGSFAVPAHRLHVVPAGMSDEVAVLTEPLTIAYHAVQRADVSAGSRCVVFGAGPIGLLIVRLLVGTRGSRAYVVDIDDERLHVAASLGAVPVRGDEAALSEAIAQQTDGEMADVVFEASGNALATRMTSAVAGHGGTVVLVGWNRGPVELDTVALMRKELSVLGSRNSVNAFPAVLRLLSDGLVDPHVLISHRFAFAEAPEALALLDSNPGKVLKVVIEGDQSSSPQSKR